MVKLVDYIRAIRCMGLEGFEQAFGKQDAEYLYEKLMGTYKQDVSKWLCYLDMRNLKALEAHIEAEWAEDYQ